ncbi:MAG: Gfo/Idh/MocA family oxidoreductase [Clostridiales bacterium]|nr:Gfo/Idh/MocA family oxidoreductase [Clostridiales bacterium]
MKLGIMGTGKIVLEALPVLDMMRPEKCFLMGREHSAGRTRLLCQQYCLDGYFLTPEELLAADVDTVYIALPNNLHFPFAKQAIAARKNVILEKPAAPTAAELEELAEDARLAGVILLEAMSTHYLSAFISIKKKLPSLGEIRMADFQFCQYSSRYDDFLKGKIAPAFDPACLGGALMDLNVYNLHALVSLFGMPMGAVYYPNMQQGIDTSGAAVLDYGTFKAVAIAAKDARAPTHSVICGENGTIHITMPANKIDRYEIIDRDGNAEVHDFRDGIHRLFYEFCEFDRIIRDHDMKKAEEMMRVSLDAAKLLERLRPY